MECIEKLHRAIQIGSIEEVKRQVELGADLDHVLGMRGTALCAAIEARNVDIARYLIQSGCSVNVADYDGEPPLLLAIRKEIQRSISLRKENLDCAKLLIHSGKCDLDQVDPLTKKSAIHFATEQNMVDVVKWLMSAGCAINKVDQNGNTPLHLAVHDGYQGIVKLLASDPVCIIKGYNKAGLIPLHICANTGDVQSMSIILNTIGQKTHDAFDWSPVIDSEMAANINAVTFYEKESCLHLAVRNGHIEVVRLLITHGADINVKNNLDQQPLMLACNHSAQWKHRDNTIPVLLLKRGANPNVHGTVRNSYVQSDLEVTPLIIAVINKNTDLAKALVQHGADINMTDSMGQTPLMVSLLKNSIEVATYLLCEFGGKGLVVNGVNWLGETCLHAVLKCYSKDSPGAVADLTRGLLRAGAELREDGAGDTPLMKAYDNEALEVLDVLLEEGGGTSGAASLLQQHVLGDGDHSLLMASVALGQLDTSRILLSHGDNINQLTESGESLLYITIYNEELGLAKFLVDNGCNLSKERYIFRQFGDSRRSHHGGDDSDEGSDSDWSDDDTGSESETELCALKENDEFRNWLQTIASSPRNLKLLCLVSIRSHFIEQKIPFKDMDRLPLPVKLRMALRYKDG